MASAVRSSRPAHSRPAGCRVRRGKTKSGNSDNTRRSRDKGCQTTVCGPPRHPDHRLCSSCLPAKNSHVAQSVLSKTQSLRLAMPLSWLSHSGTNTPAVKPPVQPVAILSINPERWHAMRDTRQSSDESLQAQDARADLGLRSIHSLLQGELWSSKRRMRIEWPDA